MIALVSGDYLSYFREYVTLGAEINSTQATVASRSWLREAKHECSLDLDLDPVWHLALKIPNTIQSQMTEEVMAEIVLLHTILSG